MLLHSLCDGTCHQYGHGPCLAIAVFVSFHHRLFCVLHADAEFQFGLEYFDGIYSLATVIDDVAHAAVVLGENQ